MVLHRCQSTDVNDGELLIGQLQFTPDCITVAREER